jgi:tRNA 2-selenouridine synthase
MAIEKLTIEAFLQLSKRHPVLDVRSPGEYQYAHIPGAINLPLFSDEERKIVGTAYKQQDRQTAIKIGLDFFGLKMRKMLEQVETFQSTAFLVHCWRGGMRSEGVSWLLNLYGYQVYSLSGGYKSFRRFALQLFSLPFDFQILGGYTGSGKTATLKELENQGMPIIDLEELARHKGSAFGDLPQVQQPSQEMFENKLAIKLSNLHKAQTIWIEDESQRIGTINIPKGIWNQMKQSPLFFLEIPFEQRLDRIIQEYGSVDKESLVNAILRIKKRLGGMEAKAAIDLLTDDHIKESFLLLLKYYDKCYQKAIDNWDGSEHRLFKLNCGGIDVQANTQQLLNVQKNKFNV